MYDIQETLDVVNYKIDTYEQKCEPVTNELIASWKVRKEENKEEKMLFNKSYKKNINSII